MRGDGGPGDLSAAGRRVSLAPAAGALRLVRRRPKRLLRAAPALPRADRGWIRCVPRTRALALDAAEGGRARGTRGARGGRRHEPAAAGAETAQPPGGPGGGDCAPPLPRPHQRGQPAGKRRASRAARALPPPARRRRREAAAPELQSSRGSRC